MSRVLITGGAGFIGSHLADLLLARGHYVRVLDSLAPRRQRRLGQEAAGDGVCHEVRVKGSR